MAFESSSRFKPAQRKKDPVFCVGWRAFVNWPADRSRRHGPVPILDANGNPMENDLADGQPVEIVSWRPRSREGVLYQIRRVTDGTEWWIGAQYLRRQAAPEPIDAVTATAV